MSEIWACSGSMKLKGCNCGGEHTYAYRGCEVSKRAEKVQRVKTSQGVTYREVVRMVGMQPNGSGVKMADRHKMRACEGCRRVKEDSRIVEKRQFILFMFDVINCTAQADRKKTET